MSEQPLRIFIGFDPRQVVSYTTLCTSIIARARKPVAITPIVLETLPIKRVGLTPFTYSRFLVPWLCQFQGTALFLDADELVLGDIAELFAMFDSSYAVQVARDQTYRFEWASVMLFNCAHPDNAKLTPEYIDNPAVSGNPHLIDWTQAVGDLPSEWNVLIGYQQVPQNPKLLHFTQGVPAFPETAMSPGAEQWLGTAQLAMKTLPWLTLMGNSVHAKKLQDGRVVPKLYPEGGA